MASILKQYIHSIVHRALIPQNSAINLSVNVGQPDSELIIRNRRLPLNRSVLGDLQVNTFGATNHLAAGATEDVKLVADEQSNYATNVIRLDSALLQSAFQEQTSTYDRRRQLSLDIADRLNTDIFSYVFSKWAPTLVSRMLLTTGKDKAGTVATRNSGVAVGGYAGLVNRIGFQDLENMIAMIKKQNIMGGTWYALPSVEQWSDIRLIEQVTDYSKTGLVDQLGRKILGSYGGVTFLDARHDTNWGSNLIYDLTAPATPVPLAYEGVLNVNCVGAMLVWNDQEVERNQGALKTFERMDDPIYMGDITNAGYRIGASISRYDQAGVLIVIEKIAGV